MDEQQGGQKSRGDYMITMDNGIDQLEELRRTIVLNDNDTIYMFINDYKALPLNEITELQKNIHCF